VSFARVAVVRALIVAASVLLVAALAAGYVRQAAVNSNQFANRATAALRDESVKSLIAERITDDVVLKNHEDLLAARPIIQAVASEIVGGRAFTNLFRAGVRDVHRAVFDRDQHTVTLTVVDVGTVLAAGLQKLRPGLARQVEDSTDVPLLKRDVGDISAKLARLGKTVRLLAWLLFGACLLCAGAALWLSYDRRQTVVELGIGAATAGVLLVVADAVLRRLAIDHIQGPEGRAAAGAVWDAFLGDLRTAAWIVAGSGAVIAASAASLIRPVDIREPLRRLADRVIEEPTRPAMRVLRGALLVAAGLVVLIARDAVIELLLTVCGVFLIYAGLTAILRLVYVPPAPGEERERPARPEPRRLAGPVLAAALIVGVVVLFVGTGGTTTAAPARGSCEGHRELCDRPLDRVVLPATHNAMSVPLPGWFSSEQEHPIARQLADGVRGLLVDTHYADRLSNGRLRTDFGSTKDLEKKVSEDGVSPEAVDAALRIRERLGFKGEGERGMYLCHTFCELGATPLEPVLDDIHDFLVSHPGEVVVVINQDYVTPADFVSAVKDADLEPLVYRGSTRHWPTLQQMIDSNQRLVLLAENHAGAAPWYHLAYKAITEETPYTFPRVGQLTKPSQLPASCKPNRGPERGPLFLINHWISTDPVPKPSDAATVNAYEPLLARARECRRVRDHLPNLLAVNFYLEGDVFRVVDSLNGVK
jgi:hypothetical protein